MRGTESRPRPATKLGVFSTGPAIRAYGSNLVTEIIGTFVLVFGILAFTNGGTPADLGALPVALLVIGIGISLGGPTGYAINPARDLGPRIIHAILPIKGKGTSDWAYSWVPVVGPLIGGALSVRALQAVDHRAAFGFNWDPSHMIWQNNDPVGFITDFRDRIYHVDCKDTRLRPANGRAGVLASHLTWGDPRRGWDFVSTGHGDVPWEDAFNPLRAIGYSGPVSVEWEDAGMDRLTGASEAVEFVRSLLWPLPESSFDSAFEKQ